jgi:TPR repeat protein
MLVVDLWVAKPSVFQQGDITVDEALRRIHGASAEAKERGRRFVESLTSTSSSESRQTLMGNWEKLIKKSRVEALKWYNKAAAQKYIVAQYNLGWCLQNGEGVVKNPAGAVR